MDRFEGKVPLILRVYRGIYIPVWIDLKAMCDSRPTCTNRYLHSSMDRFEGFAPAVACVLFIDLHSSMDRFEVLQPLRRKVRLFHLHSSMDRFEATM